MMVRMKYRLLTWYVTLAVLLAPLVASAQKEDEETALLEGRLEGFPADVRLESTNTGLLWIMIGFVSVIALGALFKNAKRTHLD